MNGRTFAWICIYTLFIVSIEALKFDDSCRNSPPFEEWIKFHSELGNSVELTTNEGLICKEEMTKRTILFTHSGDLIFGFTPLNIQDDIGIDKNSVENLSIELLRALHNLENSFWKPFLCQLLNKFPLFDDESLSRNDTPAIFWQDLSELKGTYLKDRILAEEKYFKNELLPRFKNELKEDISYYELVWAYSIAESFGISLFDGVKKQFVLSPLGSLLAFNPKSMTHFAYDERSNKFRGWTDHPYTVGSPISFYSRELTTNDLVKYFGTFINDNIFDKLYLDLYLDGNDLDYEIKEKFLDSINALGKSYPLNDLHFIEIGGLLSPEAFALMRIKHFKLPAGNRDLELKELFPDPFSQISMENELQAMKELVAVFSSRIERSYSTDAIQDISLFERRSTLQNIPLRNALGARIAEKKLLVKANRILVHNIQRLTEEISNGHKRKGK